MNNNLEFESDFGGFNVYYNGSLMYEVYLENTDYSGNNFYAITTSEQFQSPKFWEEPFSIVIMGDLDLCKKIVMGHWAYQIFLR